MLEPEPDRRARKAKQGSTVTIVVGQLTGRRDRRDDRTTTTDDAVSGRVRVAVLLGRPLERARDLARLGARR